MTFSNLFFPFVFLPLALLLYYCVPRRAKNAVLLVCSLLFFSWGTPRYLPLMVCAVVFNYFSGLLLDSCVQSGDSAGAKRALWTAVAANVLLLAFYKYTGFFADQINRLFGSSLAAPELPVPIGISFFTFSLLSYLFDVYRQKTGAAKNILDFGLYVTFFPKLVSGPIVQYCDMAPQLREHPLTPDRLGEGARLFCIGLGKKVLLANTLGTVFYALADLPQGALSVCSAWLGAVTYALMLYFDFSGYSDMAIGLGKLFGFDFKANFDYPYLSQSLSEFWRRWHISLGAWFRDYIYIPLGGSREGEGKTVRNLLIVWMLTGIWHGASWNFVFWGLYYGVLLIAEKFVLQKPLSRLPAAVRHALTLLGVLVGWVFFFSDSLGKAFSWLGAMIGIGAKGFGDSTAAYYFGSCWPVLLLAVFACLPLGARLGRRVYQSRRGSILSVLYYLLLVLLCIAGMMNDTYSSFLYFQF